jgi:prevent-host-death family protein
MGHSEVTNMAASANKHLPAAPSNSQAVSIAHAKANFSSLVTGVQNRRGAVTILRRGVPVAQIVPISESPVPKLSGSMAGTGRELGDIVSPLGIEWTIDGE